MSTAVVHQSLVTSIMIMGVPRNIFWINALLTMDLVFFGAWWLVVLSLVLHFSAAKICKQDPEFFDLLKRYYLDQDDYLEG